MQAGVAALSGKIWVLVGTRPEVIKQVPVFWALCEEFGPDRVALIGTGQHKELLDQSLRHFGVELDHNLELMRPELGLAELGGRILSSFGELLERAKPHLVIVQGDTLSAAMVGTACFLSKIKLVHNEAGLRTYDLEQPFPEEANRKIISSLAQLHFAPTERAAEALKREGVPHENIRMVGNPVVDALFWTLDQPCESTQLNRWRQVKKEENRKLVLVTSHRRENAEAMAAWYQVLGEFVRQHNDVELICPIHPNNLAREPAQHHLGDRGQVHLVDPLDYHVTCHLQKICHMVVSDSGGIQEESSTLGVPVVVCRKKTERMEAVDLGLSRLANPENQDEIFAALKWAYEKGPVELEKGNWPFGRTGAGQRMASEVRRLFGHSIV